ncbi:hypothetical protein Pelo_12988 [Pelomyxa schiedti]|nr:hypothetical protein Pelo_12988 [Pelomyxa schiedti]
MDLDTYKGISTPLAIGISSTKSVPTSYLIVIQNSGTIDHLHYILDQGILAPLKNTPFLFRLPCVGSLMMAITWEWRKRKAQPIQYNKQRSRSEARPIKTLVCPA